MRTLQRSHEFADGADPLPLIHQSAQNQGHRVHCCLSARLLRRVDGFSSNHLICLLGAGGGAQSKHKEGFDPLKVLALC